MGMLDGLLLRGLQKYIPEGSTVLGVESGRSDALGETRKMNAVLTSDSLLIATSVRTKTILTVIPRADIRSVEPVDPEKPKVVNIAYDDYARAIKRVVKLDLSRRRDRAGIIAQLEATASDG
jgi:hypothetical protein